MIVEGLDPLLCVVVIVVVGAGGASGKIGGVGAAGGLPLEELDGDVPGGVPILGGPTQTESVLPAAQLPLVPVNGIGVQVPC